MIALLELHPATAGLKMLKGRQTDRRDLIRHPARKIHSIAPSGRTTFVSDLGLKPQAKSLNPFGIGLRRTSNPTLFAFFVFFCGYYFSVRRTVVTPRIIRPFSF